MFEVGLMDSRISWVSRLRRHGGALSENSVDAVEILPTLNNILKCLNYEKFIIIFYTVACRTRRLCYGRSRHIAGRENGHS